MRVCVYVIHICTSFRATYVLHSFRVTVSVINYVYAPIYTHRGSVLTVEMLREMEHVNVVCVSALQTLYIITEHVSMK